MIKIRNKVKNLVNRFNTRDPYALCKQLGIKIFQSNLGDEITSVYQRTEAGYKIIHINNSLSENNRIFACARQLGHAILDSDKPISLFIDSMWTLRYNPESEVCKVPLNIPETAGEASEGQYDPNPEITDAISAFRLVFSQPGITLDGEPLPDFITLSEDSAIKLAKAVQLGLQYSESEEA